LLLIFICSKFGFVNEHSVCQLIGPEAGLKNRKNRGKEESMRVMLTIKPVGRGFALPFNYQYHLSSVIYGWIEKSSSEYSKFLHDKGFSPEGVTRQFKHFCFSQLLIADRKADVQHKRLIINSPTIKWYIGVPVDQTLNHIVIGLFEKQEFYIDRMYDRFIVEQVETLPEPKWDRKMKFRMLSPLTVSVAEDRNGKLMPYYLRANDPRLADALKNNIINKYRSLYGNNLHDTDFNCVLDEEYIAKRGGYDKVSKLITIKEGTEEETKVKGMMCPLTIEGNPELIKLAYESGLGEKNSVGFGMIEVV
jgi:CRISPR-associated endoribonuclease Cas6